MSTIDTTEALQLALVGLRVSANIRVCPGCGCTNVRSLCRNINSPIQFSCGLRASAITKSKKLAGNIRSIEEPCNLEKPYKRVEPRISRDQMKAYILEYGIGQTEDLLKVLTH